ncbi:hypothetical protein OAU72_04655 [Hyphomicrobiales bacterium]|jgi:D-glycerate 3-kinase|nr:hypothetical protein [Hyphomicrobiales bacterium]|tara:strand:+ start:460 stop:1284 length:825 start_codon:yes stop_codon:yes gene_type:complete
MLLEQIVFECINKINFNSKPHIIGITGSQGAGKSTLSANIRLNLLKQGINCLIVCIDDYYLSKSKRLKLAQDVHPLCAVRGVPGTHDIELLDKILSMLTNPSSYSQILFPIFSKADDDLKDISEWRVYTDKPDVIIFEGWCLGARPNFLNLNYINDLERNKDKDSKWKLWSIENCKNYLKLWEYYDQLIMIKPENFNSVIKSRWKQEKDTLRISGKSLFKNYSHIIDFCSYYENWTKGMWNNLESEVDILLTRDDSYNYKFYNKKNNYTINERD